MNTTAIPVLLNGLARRLVRDGFLSKEKAVSAQNDATAEKITFVSFLVQNKLVTSQNIAVVASQEFGIPLFDVSTISIETMPAGLIDEELTKENNAAPLFRRGNRLYVAVSDLTNLQALNVFQFNTSLHIYPIIIEDHLLTSTFNLSLENESFGDFGDDDLNTIDIGEDEGEQNDDIASGANETPIVRFVYGILATAIKSGASDIHFEPYEKTCRVRTRIDGILHEIKSVPISLAGRIAARIKVLSRLNIAERRVPQDGRMRLRLSKTKATDFRVNTCPTLFGEKIVLRILDPTSAQLGIDVLGYEEDQKKIFMDTMHKPYGMILVTGPTGSGKTVSLYTALNILNTNDRNISTVEDPAEISLGGINQVNVNLKAGLTFSSVLRAFLRQDPDVIMIGEIRDLETAEISIKAAQTGHMVLSTLHTNDAPQTLTRLANMGVPPFNIASAVSLIIAQRLARRLCNTCKVPEDLPVNILLDAGFTQKQIDKGVTLHKSIGCSACTNGYKGRVGIYQVMPVSAAMAKIIMEGGNSLQLANQAEKEGIDDLLKSGLKKAMAGLTSLAELNRVITG